MSFAAIVVCYFPDQIKLMKLVSTLLSSDIDVYIANNGGLSINLEKSLLGAGCVIKEMEGNIGIGAAINQVAASWRDSERPQAFFTFDQDSAPSIKFVADMLNEWMEVVKLHGVNQVVSPRFIDSRNGYVYLSLSLPHNKKCLLVTLQSGMLIPFNVWETCKFSDWLFIEYVDTEWCYYINSKGFNIVEAQSAFMMHEVSDAAPKKIGPWTLLKYSPIRRFYFFRNSIYLLGCNYVPLKSKYFILRGGLNRLIAILLLDGNKLKSYWMCIKGIIEGFRVLKRARVLDE
ncbi:MAG TPA: hypothetical protein PLX05_11310 [Acinetobacter parvus]|jgi:rhamnosyltransferase|uniref:hypothetical protein n=1 Tax=Acinetobacter parvus TaxID=134533 RepID=UPI002CFBEBEA|nr:hypothetical protein [Acinetobacter parvus]HRM16174.1 hypothetical protein [Acinetobacter parvus]